MNKSKSKISSPNRTKIKSPKRKISNAKNYLKKAPSSKKLNKSPNRSLKGNKSGLRKDSLGMAQRYQKRLTNDNSSFNKNIDKKLRNRSYNGSQNLLASR